MSNNGVCSIEHAVSIQITFLFVRQAGQFNLQAGLPGVDVGLVRVGRSKQLSRHKAGQIWSELMWSRGTDCVNGYRCPPVPGHNSNVSSRIGE